MTKYIFILLTPIMVIAQSYMAKIEPYDTFTIYAQSSGQIVQLDKNDETKTVNKTIISMDTSLEKKELAIYKKQLELYNKKFTILEKNYKNYIKIRGKSQSEKDDKLYVLIELQISIESLKLNIKTIEDTLKKKVIAVENMYLKEFTVNNGDYVSIGTKLATTYNLNKSKIIVYVSKDDYLNIINKKVLINGKSNIATIEKIDKTLDDTFVSAHKITLVLNDSDFGKIVKVEFVK